MPADIARSHAEVARRVGEILDSRRDPIVLGGDHSVAYPNLTAIGRHFGPGEVGVIQFDAHADTAEALGASGSRTGRRCGWQSMMDRSWART